MMHMIRVRVSTDLKFAWEGFEHFLLADVNKEGFRVLLNSCQNAGVFGVPRQE